MRKELIRTSKGEIAFNTQSGTKDELQLLGLLMVPRTTDEVYNLIGDCDPLINSLLRRGWVKINEKSKPGVEVDKKEDDEEETPLTRLRKKMEMASLNKEESQKDISLDITDEGDFSADFEKNDIPGFIISQSQETGVAAKNMKRPKVTEQEIEKSLNDFFDLFSMTPPPPENDE